MVARYAVEGLRVCADPRAADGIAKLAKDTDKEVADLPPLLVEAIKHDEKLLGALQLFGGRAVCALRRPR